MEKARPNDPRKHYKLEYLSPEQIAAIRKKALENLKLRKIENFAKKKINNSALYAGSPMFYYCESCGGISDILPETYILAEPRKFCGECLALKELGWLE